ncbi:hypothetical protein THRCLA_21016 [Thraustotheca clavata]|uniref:SGNH domain-containing protein n=1 Tax=Thraustotheca clavata TaxID=74557 RepID=A0A1W0A102_9STRA|nr:hypothetical protein THRCLA_21016 [Thraustotheca clavata]
MIPYMMLVYSFLLSVLTLHVVENQLRRRKSKWLVPALAVGMFIVVGVGIGTFNYLIIFSLLESQITDAKNKPSTPITKLLEQPNMSRSPRLAEPTVAKLLAAEEDWNPDPDNLIMVLGDSHAEMLRSRFKFLYDQAMQKGEEFPMMVFLTCGRRSPLQCMDEHALYMNAVYKMKPKDVFYSTDWPQCIRPTGEIVNVGEPQYCAAGYADDCSY